MTKKQKELLKIIEDQLYGINSRNISARWISGIEPVKMKDIEELNRLLAFIILEIRTLREEGSFNKEELHRKEFPELYD